jgi:hypothetical protein
MSQSDRTVVRSIELRYPSPIAEILKDFSMERMVRESNCILLDGFRSAGLRRFFRRQLFQHSAHRS